MLPYSSFCNTYYKKEDFQRMKNDKLLTNCNCGDIISDKVKYIEVAYHTEIEFCLAFLGDITYL